MIQLTIPCERPSLMVIVSNKSFFTGMVWEMEHTGTNKEHAIKIAQTPFTVKNRNMSLKQYSDYGRYKDKELSQAGKNSLICEVSDLTLLIPVCNSLSS